MLDKNQKHSFVLKLIRQNANGRPEINDLAILDRCFHHTFVEGLVLQAVDWEKLGPVADVRAAVCHACMYRSPIKIFANEDLWLQIDYGAARDD